MDLKRGRRRQNLQTTDITSASQSTRSSTRLSAYNNKNNDEDEDEDEDSGRKRRCSSTSDLLTEAIRKSRSDMTDAQIKSHNLLLELKEYSDKIIQLTKVWMFFDAFWMS